MNHQVTLQKLPETLAEMKELPEAELLKPEDTAALTVAALCVYPKNREAALEMLDYLRGPRPLTPMEKQFIRNRFMDGHDYIPRSYFAGAVPENDYTPDVPYVVELSDSATPIVEDGYRKFGVKSGGADSPRPIVLRNKPSTGEWFLWDNSLLVQVRIPKSSDPWA